jgi:nucleoside-diphosphate-sugar epimerase
MPSDSVQANWGTRTSRGRSERYTGADGQARGAANVGERPGHGRRRVHRLTRCRRTAEARARREVARQLSTGRRQNIAHVVDDIEFGEGNVRGYERANTAVGGVDVVIHPAALPSVPRSVQDPRTTTEINVTGTLNTLPTSRDLDVRHVVLASSSSVCGSNNFLLKHEEVIAHSISPYHVSKLAAEQYAMPCEAVYGLETVALR